MSKGPFYNKPLAFRELGYEAAMRSPTHKVHDNLWSRADIKTRTCFPSYRQIMKDTGLSRNTVYLALRELKDSGLIVTKQDRWEESQTYRANEYLLIVPTEPCPKKPKRKGGSVTVKKGNGYGRDSKGHFRGSVTEEKGGSVTEEMGKAVTVNNGNQHNPSEHKPSEHKPSTCDSKKTESLPPLNGFKRPKEPKQKPKDQKPKPSSRENEGDESSLGNKPREGEHLLSLIESIRELLEPMGPQQLKTHLIRRGYDPQVIKQALAEAEEISLGTQDESSSSLEDRPEKRRGRGKREGEDNGRTPH